MLIFWRFEIHLKIDLPIFLLSRNCDESCDRSAKLLPKGLKVKVRLVNFWWFVKIGMLIFWRFEIQSKLWRYVTDQLNYCRKILKLKVQLIICFDFFCRILSLTEILLIYITELAECLPIGFVTEIMQNFI